MTRRKWDKLRRQRPELFIGLYGMNWERVVLEDRNLMRRLSKSWAITCMTARVLRDEFTDSETLARGKYLRWSLLRERPLDQLPASALFASPLAPETLRPAQPEIPPATHSHSVGPAPEEAQLQ